MRTATPSLHAAFGPKGPHPNQTRPRSLPYAPAVRRVLTDLATLLAAFAAATGIAALLGAANLGTAMAFGQIGFAIALVWVLLR
jgi:hypothetical protein